MHYLYSSIISRKFIMIFFNKSIYCIQRLFLIFTNNCERTKNIWKITRQCLLKKIMKIFNTAPKPLSRALWRFLYRLNIYAWISCKFHCRIKMAFCKIKIFSYFCWKINVIGTIKLFQKMYWKSYNLRIKLN